MTTETLSLASLGRRAGETLYEYLERRERELASRVLAVRTELEAMETELAHVRSARRQIGNLPSFVGQPVSLAELAHRLTSTPSANPDVQASSPPSIKDMILKALWTGFRKTGATPAQLRQFISDAYGRDIDRNSMSPQISRLRQEGLLKQKGGEDNWRLTVAAVGRIQGERWYGPDPTEQGTSGP